MMFNQIIGSIDIRPPTSWTRRRSRCMWATSAPSVFAGSTKGRQGMNTNGIRTAKVLLTTCLLWLFCGWLTSLGATAYALESRVSPGELPRHVLCSAPTSFVLLGRNAIWGQMLAAILFLHEYFVLWQTFCRMVVRFACRCLYQCGIISPSKRVWQARFIQKRRCRPCRKYIQTRASRNRKGAGWGARTHLCVPLHGSHVHAS